MQDSTIRTLNGCAAPRRRIDIAAATPQSQFAGPQDQSRECSSAS
jgi:hypothetical protein